ncbi:HNH endonuclease [Loigolactobacillus rennini]|uniref:HNH endonuclease n=1 Tax=Loigolactobacillus rennini TaxID=238013 RepID=UPI0007094740|nr:HNH endonuclease [Loigolactobacillus rennini]
MFRQPKVRLGNKNYSQDELKDLQKQNTKVYNNFVRRNNNNNQFTSFYHSSEWKKLRKQVLLRDNYLCQECFKKGIVNDKNLIVHHKVELREDWSKRLDMNNLEVVCYACHNKIHKQKQT